MITAYKEGYVAKLHTLPGGCYEWAIHGDGPFLWMGTQGACVKKAREAVIFATMTSAESYAAMYGWTFKQEAEIEGWDDHD